MKPLTDEDRERLRTIGRAAGFTKRQLDSEYNLERLARMLRAAAAGAAAAERDACARLCDDHVHLRKAGGFPREASTARALAASIRARTFA